MSNSPRKPASLRAGFASYGVLMVGLLANWGIWALAPGTPLWVHIVLSIAMGVLILLVFMEMVEARSLIVFAAVTAPVFVAILFALVIADYATRPDHWRDDPFRSEPAVR